MYVPSGLNCYLLSVMLPAVCNVLSTSLEITDPTSIPLSLHRDPWSHEYRRLKVFSIVSAPRISRISVCLLDTVLNTGSKTTGLNYFTTYKSESVVFGHFLCEYSVAENHPHLCARKGLKTMFWLLHWPHLSEYNEIYKWEKKSRKLSKKRLASKEIIFTSLIR